ncbi:hypothetical protein DPMN_153467 [Dreissena polymorpha]|uniref:Uncharacterized protein n=1 Tax=Dreissena polymorpha TaxID=45954 RepID=A0A9D4J8A8_DREPO|nr:hypothetical protein DPMN_153467 [Dreissena polymorpha]
MKTRISKIIVVSQDGSTQYSQLTGESVLGFGSTACGVLRGHTGGKVSDEQEDGLFYCQQSLGGATVSF